MSSLDRVFDVLGLFSEHHPVWTVEDAMAALGHSKSTIYRYFRALAKAGLVVPVGGAYGLGPRIVELDQQMRNGDPLIQLAKPHLIDLRRKVNSVVLLMRLFHDRIICIHEIGGEETGVLSVSRGQSLALFRGATSKVILAQIPTSQLKDIYLAHSSAIEEAGLGENWNAFRANLKVIRKRGYHVSEIGQIAPHTFSIAVPIFDERMHVVGSITVLQSATGEASRDNAEVLQRIQAAGRDVTREYSALESSFASVKTPTPQEEFQEC